MSICAANRESVKRSAALRKNGKRFTFYKRQSAAFVIYYYFDHEFPYSRLEASVQGKGGRYGGRNAERRKGTGAGEKGPWQKAGGGLYHAAPAGSRRDDCANFQRRLFQRLLVRADAGPFYGPFFCGGPAARRPAGHIGGSDPAVCNFPIGIPCCTRSAAFWWPLSAFP